MGEILRRYGPAALAWILLLVLRPGPAPGRRLVRFCVLGLAVSQTALTPAVRDLTRTVHAPSVELLVAHLAMVGAVWAGAQLLLRLHGLRTSARRHTAWAVAGGAAMVITFTLAPDVLPQSPFVMEYCIAYAVALLPEFAVIARLCLQDARRAPDRILRAGLGLVVAGVVAAAAYMVIRTVIAISARAPFDFEYGKVFLLSKALPTSAHLLVLVGVGVPAAAGWLRRHRQYRRLGPLWLALYRAEPAIALEPPRATVFPTRLQLYRRVIEIRDGLLVIRPYRSGSGAGEQQEATEILAALRAREDGLPPLSPETTVQGGQDFGSDTEYLCRVADAFREISRKPTADVS
ncbi:MAB_1171c family putative transporter [Amycolatopsis sp. NPDC051061]|uniref:MAB_1171c family putative transporter n=1 Tax=Amycolatopsis sp. NPDC051061 TaxID=3155042 RepID=UPI00342A9FD9